jgi:hypothetical protein
MVALLGMMGIGSLLSRSGRNLSPAPTKRDFSNGTSALGRGEDSY